ncbi:MAG: mercuric transport protein periplasmic component [Bdellovibrio sp. CG12_big_fil_rev_8_21_14_0_65_39_13]|nr:MAG: mercuric transport protein periplasmic component [Bdellovibrio sp. CG22_combo_CG10-13_8_21_14_all_39_27]PIQ58580.1 MAG: mercuric transport protein periplasmic component [Bdellovibrio sp. CG12_big_fil_rev_8_21_14_0_65_39_13]PIR32436.1 MAG: mercuric transport protein periplasmic component [Bdellovibrio sp. CG11_big_fil_rev_8_21_14_0_20_39_38]
MKNLLLTLFASIIAQGAFAESKMACFAVEGMTCAACTITTKVAVKKLDGIEDIKVSLDEKKAEVQFNDTKTNSDEIKKKIDSVGYKATLLQCNKG